MKREQAPTAVLGQWERKAAGLHEAGDVGLTLSGGGTKCLLMLHTF